MSDNTIEEKVRAMIVEHFAVSEEEITPATMLFKDFKVDSLDILDLVMSIRKEYGVQINGKDLASLAKLGDFVNYIEKHKTK